MVGNIEIGLEYLVVGNIEIGLEYPGGKEHRNRGKKKKKKKKGLECSWYTRAKVLVNKLIFESRSDSRFAKGSSTPIMKGQGVVVPQL